MKTSTTPNFNSISNNRAQEKKMVTFFDEKIIKFYDGIKPKMNNLIKEPSSKTVNNILEFSKSLSN
jgi:hypothetical protein